jgi:hypothetical protein
MNSGEPAMAGMAAGGRMGGRRIGIVTVEMQVIESRSI